MVAQAQQRFPDLQQCSFDKGFHSPANQRALAELLEHVVLPKKVACQRLTKNANIATLSEQRAFNIQPSSRALTIWNNVDWIVVVLMERKV